ncbi:MAG: T9SS type A sorting domain-containing protein, partial [Calditrichaeota bacterium]|nr:T9SS type A sorting domain-containing protein [Calditrichota bacterium]
PTLEDAFSLAVADLEGDGAPEIVVLSKQGAVDAFDHNGNRLDGFPTRSFGPCSAPLALGNVNGRGPLEIAFVTDNGTAVVLQHNGVLLDNWPVAVRTGETSASTTPVLVDVNGDGACDVVLPTQSGGLLALAADGKPVAGFPLATSVHTTPSAAAGDLDADGKVELVVAGKDGFLYAWKLDAAAPPAGWLQFKGDAQHTARNQNAGSSPENPTNAAGLLPLSRAYCYPNPTAGDRATIRFTLTDEADVTVRIYDLAGAKVAELRTHGQRYTDNEVVWDVSAVASGVYLAKLEARSAHSTGTALIKIAVTK